MNLLITLFNYVVFPGFLFTAFAGMMASWVDRKVTARIQWRVGPPWYQSFADVVKLLGKETIVPKEGAKITFLLAPIIGLAATVLVSTLIWKTNLSPEKTFLGDLIVVLYLLVLPSLGIIIGGFASANPLASLGASREMKLVLAYELPFILAIFTPVIKAGGIIKIGELLNFQSTQGIMLTQTSGLIAFLVCILCMQAKLGLVPFDAPEAETEIMSGPFIEYSGPPLAIFKLTKMMLLFILPVFLITVFWGGLSFTGWNILWTTLKYVLLLVIIVLIRNTNPRLRIDQAVKFFWGPVTILAILGVISALIGA